MTHILKAMVGPCVGGPYDGQVWTHYETPMSLYSPVFEATPDMLHTGTIPLDAKPILVLRGEYHWVGMQWRWKNSDMTTTLSPVV